MGSIHGWGTKIPYTLCHSQKKRERDYDLLLVSQPRLSWAERGMLLDQSQSPSVIFFIKKSQCSPSAPIHNAQSFPPSPSCTVQSQPPHPSLGIFLLPHSQPCSLKALDTEPTKALLTGFLTGPSAALCPPTPPNNKPTPCTHHEQPPSLPPEVQEKSVTCECQGWAKHTPTHPLQTRKPKF